jgi:cytochrome d ubiquinol oxidase subunit II
VVAVAAVVSGWGIAQYPWLLVDEVTIVDAAGATATLQALLVAVGLAVVIVVPPLAYLFRLTQSEEWSRH